MNKCTRWAKKGYVAVAMTYRHGWNPTSTRSKHKNIHSYSSCLQRYCQDARSAIGFMRQDEANGDTYGIDGSRIVFGGHGRGGYLSLGVATLRHCDRDCLYLKFLGL